MQMTASLVLAALLAIALACVVLWKLFGKTSFAQNVSDKLHRKLSNAFQGFMVIVRSLAYVPVWMRFGHRETQLFANIGEGTHEGNVTKQVDAVISSRYLVAKFGTDINHVDICTQATIPIGIITDEAAAIGDRVNVELLLGPQTKKVQCAAALAINVPVYCLAGGQVGTPAGSSGVAYQIGWTLTATTTQGDLVEIIPMAGISKTF